MDLTAPISIDLNVTDGIFAVNDVSFPFNEGVLLWEAKQPREALQKFVEAIKLQSPGEYHPKIYGYAANCAKDLRQFDTALYLYRFYDQIKPGDSRVQFNVASFYRDLGEFDLALEHMRKAHALDPDDRENQLGLSQSLLLTGNFDEGWRAFAARQLGLPIDPRFVPFWDGRPLNDDQKLVIWREQGLGEELMFANVYPDILDRAKNVVFVHKPRLVGLLRTAFPQATVTNTTDLKDAAYQLPAGTAVGMFRRSFSDFPKVQRFFVRPDPLLVHDFRRSYGEEHTLIGVSWCSPRSDIKTEKNIPVDALRPLLGLEDVKLISLQYGNVPAPDWIFDDWTVNRDGDLRVVAAQIEAMDVVVTSSSLVAHICGALGKRCYVLLPHNRGLLWHWFLDRSDSPWWPSLVLVRQEPGEPWRDVVARAAGQIGVDLGVVQA